jgi:hypothetical protein
MFVSPGQQRPAKADRKALYLDPAAPRHPKMTKLMNGHYQPQGYKKVKNRLQ